MEVAAQYGNCLHATQAVATFQPDVVLMDIDMPGISGIEGVRQIKAQSPDTCIIMFTVFEDEDRLFQCLCAGANGYLLKKTPPAKIPEAIREVMQGGAPLSPSIAAKVIGKFKQPVKTTTHTLTQREMEILHCMVKGLSAPEMAKQLSISYETIRTHMKTIYKKLHVKSATQAVAKAMDENFF